MGNNDVAAAIGIVVMLCCVCCSCSSLVSAATGGGGSMTSTGAAPEAAMALPAADIATLASSPSGSGTSGYAIEGSPLGGLVGESNWRFI